MIKLFLLSGKAESGKNAVGDIIKDFCRKEYGKDYTFSSLAFADNVKDIAESMGWDRVKDIKGRELLQNIGNSGRAYDRDIWVKMLFEKVKEYVDLFRYYPKGCNYIFCITDVRFPNEVEKMHEYSDNLNLGIHVYNVRIERPNFSNKLTEEQRKDVSEVSLDCYDKWDKVFINDKDLNSLKEDVFKWLKTLD